MKILRVYVDASVIGGCFDPEFANESQALVKMAEGGEIILVASSVLLEELKKAPVHVKDLLGSLPHGAVEYVETSNEAERLHELYLQAGVVGGSAADDARHVAIATVAAADVIVSWNFKHIVHFDKIKAYNAVNLKEGYPILSIYTPKEMV